MLAISIFRQVLLRVCQLGCVLAVIVFVTASEDTINNHLPLMISILVVLVAGAFLLRDGRSFSSFIVACGICLGALLYRIFKRCILVLYKCNKMKETCGGYERCFSVCMDRYDKYSEDSWK